jgi:hypothetical protein
VKLPPGKPSWLSVSRREPHASLRSVTDLALDSPMEIGSEMARIILHMRRSGQNTKANRQRLELLAEHFLRVSGQESASGSIAPIQSANRTPGGVTLTM